MARSNAIHCDWCHAEITDRAIVYSFHHLKPFATWEGARYSFDFCSQEHLSAWRDWERWDRIGCGFTWREPKGEHICVCNQTRYCVGNHGRRTETGWDRDCWCECGSHANRPADWPEKRFDEESRRESVKRRKEMSRRLIERYPAGSGQAQRSTGDDQ